MVTAFLKRRRCHRVSEEAIGRSSYNQPAAPKISRSSTSPTMERSERLDCAGMAIAGTDALTDMLLKIVGC